MRSLPRRAIAVFLCALPLAAACGGDEFDSGGAGGGTDAAAGSSGSSGSAGSGATCGSAGAGGADVGACTSELYCKTCNQVSTGAPACDNCARTVCCQQALECMQDLSCARLMACYFASCKNVSATSCIFPSCDGCTDTLFTTFLAVADCIQDNCKGADGGADPCPQLIP